MVAEESAEMVPLHIMLHFHNRIEQNLKIYINRQHLQELDTINNFLSYK